jgi:protein-tyrosine-phosphatase
MTKKYSFTLRRLIPLILILLPSIAAAKVFVRWTRDVVPPAKVLGISELVVPWAPERVTLLKTAATQGYRVYVESTLQQAADIASVVQKYGATGIIVNPEDATLASVERAVQKLRAIHPKLVFRLVNPNAIQPQMKGTLVINKGGVLQVTSPTAQPWLDTNLALVKLEQAFRPAQVPLYSFNWNLMGAGQQQGPDLSDYALAVGESGAFEADLILSLHDALQRGLAQNDPKAWAIWKPITNYLHFYPQNPRHLIPEVNVAVISDENPESFEAINLLARHNIGVRVLRSNQISESSLQPYDVVIVFPSLSRRLIEAIAHLAANGRTAVLVNPRQGSYPWRSSKGVKTDEASVSYARGKGKIIELGLPISDPETFAVDVRRLIDNSRIQISLWNALTTVGVLYREPRGNNKIVELVNYAADPVEVQIRVKGVFPVIRYESPEVGCCNSINPVIRDGFTEFAVPSLTISGRVHLEKSSPPLKAAPRT